jgi:hypothetical protein
VRKMRETPRGERRHFLARKGLERTLDDAVGLKRGEDNVGNPEEDEKSSREVLQHCNSKLCKMTLAAAT